MKISKVNHTRAAVAKRSNGIEGILYQDPNRKSRSDDLLSLVRERNKNAQRLYNILNQPQKRGNLQKNRNILNRWFRELFFNKNEINDLSDVIRKIEVGRGPLLNKKDVEECLTLLLRKKLQNEKAALLRIHDMAGKGRLTEEDKTTVNSFLTALKRDYLKKETEIHIVRSIERQNLPVQASNSIEDNGIVLSSNKSGNKNQLEKAALKSFMHQYACLEDKKRIELLRKIRRLIDLFFYVKKEDVENGCLPQQVDCSSFNVWIIHEERKRNTSDFVEVPQIPEREEKGKLFYAAVKNWKQDLHTLIRRKNMECYRMSMKVLETAEKGVFFEQKDINLFWIHHFENSVERLLKSVDDSKLFKLKLGYLSEKVWKDVLNYLSIKFVAIGKAVYHYAMNDLVVDANADKEEHILGSLSSQYNSGLTSFQYEEIKAEETLQREVAVAVSFAANNLARATVKLDESREDFLQIKDSEMEENLLSLDEGETLRMILQFFGGKSSWNKCEKLFLDAYDQNCNKEAALLIDLQRIVNSLRNESFHFKTLKSGGKAWNHELFARMFKKEAEDCITGEKEKFYSNNLPMFYSSTDLEGLLNYLYSEYHLRASQVPSFNSIIARPNFPRYLQESFNEYGNPAISNPENKAQWYSAFYYALKEVYYNAFLASGDRAKGLFYRAIEEEGRRRNKAQDNNIEAYRSFSQRCAELKDKYDLSSICQIIMTEFNLQNSGEQKVKTAADSKKKEDGFQHYRMLLRLFLGKALARFVKETKELQFLYKNVRIQDSYEMPDKDSFLPEWRSGMYDSLIQKVNDPVEGPELQKWYIISRLLSGRMLNSLAGSLRSYLQFTQDIKRRAEENHSGFSNDRSGNRNRIRKALEVLDMGIRLSSRFSNDYKDYFRDEEDYAEYLSHYLDLGSEDGLSYKAKLDYFCNSSHRMLQDNQTGMMIYMDGKNPIPNRNIILSKLFGPYTILEYVVEPIKQEEVLDYYEAKEKITNYRAKGICDSKEEQEKIIQYQQKINHIEFRYIAEYGELINDLLGQMINWTYLRERDLMYFQLGFHYMCLKKDGYKELDGYGSLALREGGVIKNPILQQIAALYVYGAKMISYRKGYSVFKRDLQTGSKVTLFTEYSSAVCNNSDIQVTNPRDDIYTAGLELFERINEHADIVKLRNMIDHFYYYTSTDETGCLMDMYSEIFDRFFMYDMKYQKNVPNMLCNILERYFVVLKPEISSVERENPGKATQTKRAQITIGKGGLFSDQLTYKIKGGSIEIDAKDRKYLETVCRILRFKKGMDKEDLWKCEYFVRSAPKNQKGTIKNQVKPSYHNTSSKKTPDEKYNDNTMLEALKGIKF